MEGHELHDPEVGPKQVKHEGSHAAHIKVVGSP